MPASPQRRRGRHHQPIPTAILLRNAILPPSSSDGDHVHTSLAAEDRSGRRRRPVSRSNADHDTVGLLPPPSSLRMELVADRAALSEDMVHKLDQVEGRGDDDEIILHTSALPFTSASSPVLHPQWYHLDEKVALLEHARQRWDAKCDAGTTGIDAVTWETIYKSLRARIVMQLSESCTSVDGLDGRDGPASDSTVVVLAKLPLYPTVFRRLPRSTPGGDAIDEEGGDAFHEDQNSPRNSASADAVTNIVVPPALPPNALLVHYSDGKTRIDPNLYQRLVKAGVVSEVKSSVFGRKRVDSGVLEDQIREDRKARRFDDDLFDMLGGKDIDGGDAKEGVSSHQESGLTHTDSDKSKDSARDNNTSFKDDAFDLLGGGGHMHEESTPMPSVPTNTQNYDSTTIDNGFAVPNSESLPPPETRFEVIDSPRAIPTLPTSDDAEIEEITAEISELRTMLANEEQCLQEEQSKLANAASGLHMLVEETKYTKLETEMMNEDALEQEHLRNGVAVYPLFRERVVEQEQFDRACTLLSRNVECLLRVRCIVVPNNRPHILEKVNFLFEEAD